MRLRIITTALTLALAAALAAAPASAADGDHYVALGDSYAAGTGTATVVDLSANPCLRSDSAYPNRLAAAGGYLDFDTYACAGASTRIPATDVPPYWQPSLVTEDVDVVTMTLGGNDFLWFTDSPLRWTDVLRQCLYAEGVMGSPGCRTWITDGPDMPGLSARITDLVSEVSGQAPDASILVSGYPRLFGSFSSPTCTVGTATLTGLPVPVSVPVLVAKQDARWLNQQVTTVNNAIRRGVNAAREMGVDVTFVDVAPAFNGHGLCDRSEPWLNGVLGLEVVGGEVRVWPQSFHLTANGDAAYADRFLARGFGE